MAVQVAGAGNGVPADGDELGVGTGHPGIQFLVSAELGAFHELGTIGCPQTGDGGAA